MKQTARIIRNNVPYTLLPNGVVYGEPVHVPTVALVRELPDTPPMCITVGSTGAAVSGSFYWDSASVGADDGVNFIKLASLVTGRYRPVTVGSGGPPTGAAGTDVTGSYPSGLTVSAVRGTSIGTAGGSLTTGHVLRTTGAAAATWGPLDLANSSATTNQLPLSKLPQSGATDGQALKWSTASNQWVPAAVGSASAGTVLPGNVGQSLDTVSGPVAAWVTTRLGTYADVRSAGVFGSSAPASVILVRGRAAIDDGGGGLFSYDASDVASADNGGTILVGNGGERFKRIFSGPLDARWFGADPTGVADSLAAFVAAKAVADVSGGAIYFPRGVYRFSAEINFNTSLEMFGEGASGLYYKAATVFYFPKGSRGIRIHDQAPGAYIHDIAISGTGVWTPGGAYDKGWTRWAPTTAYGLGAIIVPPEWSDRGYALKCTTAGTSGATPPAEWHTWADVTGSPTMGGPYSDGSVVWTGVTEANGISIAASQVTLENIYIRGFSNNGISANNEFANITKIKNVTSNSNGGHGLFMAGSDANAGGIEGCNFVANGGWAVHDRSLLGNRYAHCHAQDNEGGAAFVIHGVVEGMYAEGGQGPSWIDGVVVGSAGQGSGIFDGLVHYYRKPWGTGHTIAVNDTRRPTVPNGWYYRALDAGTTSGAEPTWKLGKGQVATGADGIRWECYGIWLDETAGPTIVNTDEVSNLMVRNRRNPDDVRMVLGPVGSGDTNQLYNYSFFEPVTGLGRDIYEQHYEASQWCWQRLNGFVFTLWEHYDRGNPRKLDHRPMYYPWGVHIGRMYSTEATVGTVTSDYGVRQSAGNGVPTTGLWFKGYVHWHADGGATDPIAWLCTTAGGWSDTTRANSTAVALRAIIEPTAGHIWECTTGGTTAGSPPAFVAGNDYTDGTAFWTYRGVEPPLFTPVYPDLVGTGSPEGVVTAPVGATFRRTDGGAGTILYGKESGAGNTGWIAYATGSDRVPSTRTLTGTTPIRIDGDNTAKELSANRTISVASATVEALGVITLAGDLSGTGTVPQVIKINGASVPGAGSLTTGHVLQVTGTSTLSYGKVPVLLTETISTPPLFNAAAWSFVTGNNSGLIQSATNGGDKCAFILDLPEGYTLSDLEVWIQPPGGHGGLPATMPRFTLTRVDRNTGVATLIDTEIDASGSVPAYEAYHSIQMGGLAEVINRATRKYVLNFVAEADANALAGTTIGMIARTVGP